MNGSDEDPRTRILSEFAQVGDGAADRTVVEGQIAALVSKFQPEVDASFETIGYAIVRCGTELAHKAPIYATLAGLLSVSDTKGAELLANYVAQAVRNFMTQAFREGKGSRVRQAFRLVAGLVNANVIAPTSLADWVEALLGACESEIQDPDREVFHARGPFLADALACTLPWVAGPLSRFDGERWSRIVDASLTAIDTYIHQPTKPWEPFAPGNDSIAVMVIAQARTAIEEMRERAEWFCAALIQPQVPFSEQLSNGRRVLAPELLVPPHSKTSRYSPLRYRLVGLGSEQRVEAKNQKDMEAAPSAKKEKGHSEKFVIGELLSDILENFDSKHNMAAGKLLNLPTPFKPDEEIVEEVMSKLFSFPWPHSACVFYAVVVMDLCRAPGSTLPIVLLTAMDNLFAKCGELDPEAFDRLTEWFSHHLSNFQFRFNWDEWGPYSKPNAPAFQKLFCSDSLARCSRLWYVENVKRQVGVPEVLPLFPPPAEPILWPDTDHLVEQLHPLITGRTQLPPPEVDGRLKAIVGSLGMTEKLLPLFRTILFASSKTFTHFDTIGLRYISLLREYAIEEGQVSQRAIVAEVWRFWKASPEWINYIVQRLCSYGLVRSSVAMECVLDNPDPDGQAIEFFSLSSVWEHIRLLFRQESNRVHIARAQVSLIAKAASQATEAEMDREAERLSQAREEVANSAQALEELISMIINKLVDRFSEAQAEVGFPPELESKREVVSWRILGFIYEIGRKSTESWKKDAVDGIAARTDVPELIERLSRVSNLARCDIFARDPGLD